MSSMAFPELVLWAWIALAYLAEAFFFFHIFKLKRYLSPSQPSRYFPRVTLIVPFKGRDFEMEKNIQALLDQDYKKLDIIFVSDSRDDPSYPVLKKYAKKNATLLIRDQRFDQCSSKIGSHLTALEKARGEVLVFADGDVRPGREWVESLIQPLENPGMGATTTAPWYIPPLQKDCNTLEQSNSSVLAACLQAAWFSSTRFSFIPSRGKDFLMGCSFAIRRELFERLEMKKLWASEISDDASLTVKLRKEGLPIFFVPSPVPLIEPFTFEKFQELSTRWVKIVKHYFPKSIRIASLFYGFQALVFLSGIFFLFKAMLNPSFFFPAGLLLLPSPLSILRAALRFHYAGKLLPEWKDGMRKTRWRVILLDFFVKFLILYNILQAKRMKTISWRGREYRL